MSKSCKCWPKSLKSQSVSRFVKNNARRQIQKFVRTRQMKLIGIKRQYIWIVKSVETEEFFGDSCNIVEDVSDAKRFDNYDTARHVAATLRHYLEDEKFDVVRLADR